MHHKTAKTANFNSRLNSYFVLRIKLNFADLKKETLTIIALLFSVASQRILKIGL